MLLLGNGRVITRDPSMPYLADGAVAMEGEVIREVGSTAALKAKYSEASFVDAKGGVIMPGLINAHTQTTPPAFWRCWKVPGGTSTAT